MYKHMYFQDSIYSSWLLNLLRAWLRLIPRKVEIGLLGQSEITCPCDLAFQEEMTGTKIFGLGLLVPEICHKVWILARKGELESESKKLSSCLDGLRYLHEFLYSGTTFQVWFFLLLKKFWKIPKNSGIFQNLPLFLEEDNVAATKPNLIIFTHKTLLV